MGSGFPSSIPIIDFSKPELVPGTILWESVKSQVKNAIDEYGSFRAVFNNEPQKEFQRGLIDSLKLLFEQPVEAKKENVSGKDFCSYIGQIPRSPFYESFVFNDPTSSENIDRFVNVVLPPGNPCFSKSLHSLVEEVLGLQEKIRRMIVESLGVEKYWDEHKHFTEYALRMQKYEGPKTTKAEVALIPHRDTNILTILYQSQINGLEVQSKDGDWITIQPLPNSFTVLVGESLNAWANGRLHVPLHRVMMTGNEARYSIGLFAVPKAGYMVKAPEEMVDEAHPLLYKPFDYSEYRKFRSTPNNLVVEIKAYCGTGN